MFVDVGNKSFGLEALMKYLGFQPSGVLHVGDRWARGAWRQVLRMTYVLGWTLCQWHKSGNRVHVAWLALQVLLLVLQQQAVHPLSGMSAGFCCMHAL